MLSVCTVGICACFPAALRFFFFGHVTVQIPLDIKIIFKKYTNKLSKLSISTYFANNMVAWLPRSEARSCMASLGLPNGSRTLAANFGMLASGMGIKLVNWQLFMLFTWRIPIFVNVYISIMYSSCLCHIRIEKEHIVSFVCPPKVGELSSLRPDEELVN